MPVPAALLFAQVGLSAAAGALRINAADEEAKALEFAADQEADNARIRNANRSERLLQIIATNNAARGASGVGTGGSAQIIMEDNIRKSSKAARADFMNSRSNQLSLKARASAARVNSRMQAITSLLGTGVDVAKTGGI